MKKLKVLVSLITDDNDYQLEQAATAQATAQKLGITVEIIYANNDGVNQSLQLVQAIQSPPESRPDAIVVEAVGTGMPQVAHAAALAKVGWVMLNRSVDYVAKLGPCRRLPSSAWALTTKRWGVCKASNSILFCRAVAAFYTSKVQPLAMLLDSEAAAC